MSGEFWKKYIEDQRAKIAQRRADAAAGIRRCAERDCNEPVAGQRRPSEKYGVRASAATSKQSYCVVHAAEDEQRRRVRQENQRQARKRAHRERLAEVAQRIGA